MKSLEEWFENLEAWVHFVENGALKIRKVTQLVPCDIPQGVLHDLSVKPFEDGGTAAQLLKILLLAKTFRAFKDGQCVKEGIENGLQVVFVLMRFQL